MNTLLLTYPHIQECRRLGMEARVSAKGGKAAGGSSSCAGAPLTRTSGTRKCRPLITNHYSLFK